MDHAGLVLSTRHFVPGAKNLARYLRIRTSYPGRMYLEPVSEGRSAMVARAEPTGELLSRVYLSRCFEISVWASSARDDQRLLMYASTSQIC